LGLIKFIKVLQIRKEGGEMQALIVAAGRGSRLRHRFSPKPLVPVFGLSLIERIILRCKRAGIREFVIVVGYKAEEIMRKIGDGERYGVKIKYVVNDEWKKGNGVSVLKARGHVGEKFFLLMADHLFDESILEKLKNVSLDKECCILCIDKDLEGDHFNIDDVTKVLEEESSVKRIGKKIQEYNAIDTGIFLCTDSIFDALEESVKRGQYSLSAGNQILADRGKLKTLDVTGHFWVDVDDEIALRKAKRILIRQSAKVSDGPISRRLNRPLSTRISSLLAHYNITPNQMTFFSFFLALSSALLFYLGGYPRILAAGILAQLASILDGCDGELARLKFLFSKFGEKLDKVLDRFADGLIILGMTRAAWVQTYNEVVWFAGFLALIGSFTNSYTATWYDEIIKKKKGFRLGRDVRLFIVFVGALLNQLPFTLIILAIITIVETIRRLFVLRYEHEVTQ